MAKAKIDLLDSDSFYNRVRSINTVNNYYSGICPHCKKIIDSKTSNTECKQCRKKVNWTFI